MSRTTKVYHVDCINGHEVVPLLSKCMVEIGEYGAYDINLHWEQSAFYIKYRGRVVSAITYLFQAHKNVYWINAAYVEKRYRQRGHYRLLFDALVTRAKEKEVAKIQGSIAWDNNAMRAAALAVGRLPVAVTYSLDVEKEKP